MIRAVIFDSGSNNWMLVEGQVSNLNIERDFQEMYSMMGNRAYISAPYEITVGFTTYTYTVVTDEWVKKNHPHLLQQQGELEQ